MSEYTPKQIQLMDAYVKLIENGVSSPGLKEVAKEVGYASKGSPDNHFKGIDTLVAHTVRRELAAIDETIEEPTDDLRSDLIKQADNYARYLTTQPFLALMLRKIFAKEQLRRDLRMSLKNTTKRLVKFNEHHRAAGRWCRWVQNGTPDETLLRVSLPFLGPIFALAVWGRIGIVPLEFDPVAHTDAFLEGYRNQSGREKMVAERLISTLSDSVGLDSLE